MGEQWMLQVEGVDGESTVRGFERWIAADSYSWGVSVATGDTATGRAARKGRASFANLVVTAPISAASPPLVNACVTGRILSSVILRGIRDGDARAGDVFLSYELGDATLVAVHHRDDDATTPTEELEFTYESIRITYTPQDARGGAGNPVTTDHRTHPR